MANPGNQHCASCIGTLSFAIIQKALETANTFAAPHYNRHRVSYS